MTETVNTSDKNSDKAHTRTLAGSVANLVATMLAREMHKTCGTLFTTRLSAACRGVRREKRGIKETIGAEFTNIEQPELHMYTCK